MKLYAIFSLYNLFITLVKLLSVGEKADLVIGTQMPNHDAMIPRLKNLPCIGQIYVFDSVSYKQITYSNRLQKLLFHQKIENEYVEERLHIDWNVYHGQIYVYNDFEILGFYLVNRRIYYHLIEDGLNFFTYFHKFYQLPLSVYDQDGWKTAMKNVLHIGHRLFGTSQYATDIEVNSLEGLVISARKVYAVPRKDMFAQLSAENQKLLYNIFCTSSVETRTGIAKRTMLLCTQPLVQDGQLRTMQRQERAYEDILKEYTGKGYAITIKPHPRDTLDYTALCERYDCWLIDRYIPSEALNFNPDIHFDLGLSISTTAIESLQFVSERKYLDFVYLEKYKG